MTDTDCLDYSKEYSLICLIFHPNKLRMTPNMRQIALQKAVFCTLKGHLSQCERWPFGKPLIVSEL